MLTPQPNDPQEAAGDAGGAPYGAEPSDAKARRAEPLAPDDRRRAIAQAVAPLLIERGPAVTTRELAERAGVAEGTLFTVFPDKRAVIEGAIAARLDPEPLLSGLAAIDRGQPLTAQLERAMEIVLAGMDDVVALLTVLHSLRPRPAPRESQAKSSLVNWGETVTTGFSDLLAPHAGALRLAPERVASAVVGLMFAAKRPYAAPRESLTSAQVVDLVMNGALLRPENGGNPCP